MGNNPRCSGCAALPGSDPVHNLEEALQKELGPVMGERFCDSIKG